MSSSTSVRSAAASYAGQTGAPAPLGSGLGRVFLVMEYVEGGTLRRWSALAPWPWREVVRTLLGAGEGPGAAHVAGMVHRDFKPENVLLGAEGRRALRLFGGLDLAAARTARGRGRATGARPDLTEALAAEGQLLRRLGREGEGVERARAAARLLEGVTLRGARSVKSSLRVARLLVDSALAPGAETLVTRTLQVLEAPSAHDDRSLAEALELAGECALDQGDAARARTLFARSQTQRNLPRTQLALIKLAALEPRRRAGAVRLARELLRALKSSPEDLAMGFNLRRWIAGLAAARTPGSSG